MPNTIQANVLPEVPLSVCKAKAVRAPLLMLVWLVLFYDFPLENCFNTFILFYNRLENPPRLESPVF